MSSFKRKEHWENIYNTKRFNNLSWYQPKPTIAINFLKQHNLPKNSHIIDVGGGDSYFVDYLLKMGYKNITVLDISEKAINKAQKRLGEKANTIQWVVSDIINYKSINQFDFWYDRAVFHFLTKEKEIDQYGNLVKKFIKTNGFLLIGTFSEQGPKKCSGIPIKQYSEKSMNSLLKDSFKMLDHKRSNHKTPSNTSQNFIFCTFKKL